MSAFYTLPQLLAELTDALCHERCPEGLIDTRLVPEVRRYVERRGRTLTSKVTGAHRSYVHVGEPS